MDDIGGDRRFAFGQNWRSFAAVLDERRIRVAEASLGEMLAVEHLAGRTFIDVGSGSGLFSLAARRLGARVHSFDYDPESVSCTRDVKARYYPGDDKWVVENGSVLDVEFLNGLGRYDIVYAWGVLHHTGRMWEGLHNVSRLVKPGGSLFIALYNDQGRMSRMWRGVKRVYCSGLVGRVLVCAVFMPSFGLRCAVSSLVKRRSVFAAYRRERGMSIIHDWFDWLGGYPFEVARVDDVFRFYSGRGFILKNIKTTSSWGNNEFVFENSNG